MNRKILLVLVSAVVAVGLLGCGKQSPSGKTGKSAAGRQGKTPGATAEAPSDVSKAPAGQTGGTAGQAAGTAAQNRRPGRRCGCRGGGSGCGSAEAGVHRQRREDPQQPRATGAGFGEASSDSESGPGQSDAVAPAAPAADCRRSAESHEAPGRVGGHLAGHDGSGQRLDSKRPRHVQGASVDDAGTEASDPAVAGIAMPRG